ncbi:MAG: isotrichodermin C-15 hydroxylase [Lasallia pustulata]|uniref:Isotrichodermin C-15 hydroxylase n=1 Tax=Lasallia pustulata TaxID=136370 RepID=A0A5M8PIK9_9LECA|nr:MAG: isotrichodermin C-15 hydroxylase [Lasallia pustulata]
MVECWQSNNLAPDSCLTTELDTLAGPIMLPQDSFLPPRALTAQGHQRAVTFRSPSATGSAGVQRGPRSCMGRHLAWAEMRLIIARLLWTINVESAGKSLKWTDLRTFFLVEKKPLELRIRTKKT